MTHKPSLRVFRTSSELAAAAALDAASVIRDAVAARGQARLIAATGASQIAVPRPSGPQSRTSTGRRSSCSISTNTSASAADASGELPQVSAWSADRPDGHHDGAPARRRAGSRGSSAGPLAPRSRRRRSTSRSSASARTAISPSTIRPRTSTRASPTSSSTLDDACRRQQVGEGWFATLDDVPSRAISMSVRQILEAHRDPLHRPRRAQGGGRSRVAWKGPITPKVPASILQTHPAMTIYSRSRHPRRCSIRPAPVVDERAACA